MAAQVAMLLCFQLVLKILSKSSLQPPAAVCISRPLAPKWLACNRSPSSAAMLLSIFTLIGLAWWNVEV